MLAKQKQFRMKSAKMIYNTAGTEMGKYTEEYFKGSYEGETKSACLPAGSKNYLEVTRPGSFYSFFFTWLILYKSLTHMDRWA